MSLWSDVWAALTKVIKLEDSLTHNITRTNELSAQVQQLSERLIRVETILAMTLRERRDLPRLPSSTP